MTDESDNITPTTVGQIRDAISGDYVDELEPLRLVAEIRRLRKAGWTVSTCAVIRPTDAYDREVYDALNVFGEGQI